MSAIDELAALLDDAGVRPYWVPPRVCLACKRAHLLGALAARAGLAADGARRWREPVVLFAVGPVGETEG